MEQWVQFQPSLAPYSLERFLQDFFFILELRRVGDVLPLAPPTPSENRTLWRSSFRRWSQNLFDLSFGILPFSFVILTFRISPGIPPLTKMTFPPTLPIPAPPNASFSIWICIGSYSKPTAFLSLFICPAIVSSTC